MAKAKTGSTIPGNVAAAHEYLDDAAMKIGKHNDTLQAAFAETQERAEQAEEQLAKALVDHQRELASVKTSMQRDIDMQKQRADVAEAKVKRLAADLA